ncbi:hypothetical protein BC829DRAFT_400697 [Chytridium lagenaria]|nr:hypothetical protein BC829DRAFT_400697 [Chytridium lagenaria]
MQLTTILLLVSLCVLAHLQIALSQRARRPNREPAPTEDPTPSEDPKPDEEDPAPKPTRSPRRTRPAPSPSQPTLSLTLTSHPFWRDVKRMFTLRMVLAINLTGNHSNCFKKVRRAGNPLNLFTVSIPKEECMCDPIRLYDACLGVNECDSGVAGLREIFDTTTTKNPKTKKPKTTTSVPETTELTVTTEQPKPISTEKKDPSLITPRILAVVVGAAF